MYCLLLTTFCSVNKQLRFVYNHSWTINCGTYILSHTHTHVVIVVAVVIVVVVRVDDIETGGGELSQGRSLPKLKNPTTLSIIREHG